MKRIIIIAASGTVAFFMPLALIKIMFSITDVPLILEAVDVVSLTLLGAWIAVAAAVVSAILTDDWKNR